MHFFRNLPQFVIAVVITLAMTGVLQVVTTMLFVVVVTLISMSWGRWNGLLSLGGMAMYGVAWFPVWGNASSATLASVGILVWFIPMLMRLHRFGMPTRA